ncbi:MAG: hypothetical protein O2856_19890, partial [Planctomycetota bacterium]|nr:hypothetical protein [Planctomycetota bacterium]
QQNSHAARNLRQPSRRTNSVCTHWKALPVTWLITDASKKTAVLGVVTLMNDDSPSFPDTRI